MVRQRLRFGDCTLDIAARELRRADERVELPPIVFDCMAYLVEHRDRAVGRDELVAAVWGRTSISDTMLGKAILAIRRAVGDDAERQAVLRTVPRFGYHWVAAVDIDVAVPQATTRRDGAAAPDPASQPLHSISDDQTLPLHQGAPAQTTASSGAEAPLPRATPSSTGATRSYSDAVPASQLLRVFHGSRRRRQPRRGLAFAAIAVLVFVVVVGVRWLREPTGGAAPGLVVGAVSLPADSCAILPAEIVADAADSWLRLGVMDLLATRLRGAGLPVVSSDSIVRLAPAGVSADAAVANLRRAVDVQHLVQPALRRSGPAWIARADLIAPDGSRRSLQAQADSPIAAANAVADQLLGLLGRGSSGPPARAANLSLAELLQRVDAARLSDQLDQARALIAASPVAQRAEPELRLREIQIDLRAGDLEAARTRIEQLLADVPAESDPVLQGRALESLCVVLSRGGDLAAALTTCDHAIALLETQRQPIALGRAYNHRGIVQARELRREAATADFARARVVLGTAGDPLLLAMVDGNESAFAMEQGRPADALPGLQRAGEQFQRFGMLSEFAVAQVNLVEAQLALLQPLDALKASDLGWAQRARVGDPSLRQRVRVERAEALAANGRLGEARSVYDEVLHGADASAASRAEPALARAGLARLELAGDQPAAAVLLARQGLPDLVAPEFTRQRALAWLVLQRSLQRLGRNADAQAESAAFSAWAVSASKAEARVLAGVAQAEREFAQGDALTGLATQRRVQQLAAAQARPDIAAVAAGSYGEALLLRGDLREASVVIGQLARHAQTDYDAALLQWKLYRALGQQEAAERVFATLRRLAGERPLPAAGTIAPAITDTPQGLAEPAPQ